MRKQVSALFGEQSALASARTGRASPPASVTSGSNGKPSTACAAQTLSERVPQGQCQPVAG